METSSKPRLATSLLLAILLICVSGCGRRMLKNYSSLAPKMAGLSRMDSTIRSQDVKPVNQIPGTTTWDGHAGPKVRLLTPQFGNVGEIDAPSVAPSVITTAPSPDVDDSVRLPEPPESGGGHSLGITAEQIRNLMNKRLNKSVREVELLSEKDAQWQVLSSNVNLSEEQPPSPAPSVPANPFSNLPNSSDPSNIAQFAAQEPTAADPISDSTAIPEERSVLDRLKGLYDDQEQTARQLWKRNLQRIQSPWSVFRDRDKAASEAPVAASPESPEPELPVQATPTAPGIDHSPTLLLIESIKQELANWPRQPNGRVTNPEKYRRRQQDMKLLHLIADQPGAAIASIDGMQGAEQEFWQELMLSLAHYRSSEDMTDEQRITVTAGQLRSAVKSLAPLATLGFRRLEICSRINSFGRIQPFHSNDFETGQPLLLYAELENFGTELTSQGKFRTSFDAQLQFLHHDSDEPIETIELTEITDEATSERTDYFQSFELNVPSHLAAGQYRIRLRLRDRVRRKTAEGFVEFQVRLTPERPPAEL